MASRRDVKVSEELFRDILPRVGDLTELKAILQVTYRSSTSERPTVSFRELLVTDALRSIVGLNSPEPAEDRLRSALDRAVANGFLLRLTAGNDVWYLPATDSCRALLDRLRSGNEHAVGNLGLSPVAEIIIDRPNVFSLFERHIGPLTPLLAEQLRDAERSYPRAWIERAILTAVHYESRSWRYIEAILVRWESSGGPDAADRSHA